MDKETRDRIEELAERLRKMEVGWEFWIPYWLEWQQVDWQKGAELAAVISHTIIVVVLVVAAVVVTLTGADATLIWGLVGGYIGGGVVQKITTNAANPGGTTPRR